jgi:hypothetical protein
LLPSRVIITDHDDGQQLTHSVGQRGTVLRQIGPFYVVELDNGNVRATLKEYAQPFLTAKDVERQFKA